METKRLVLRRFLKGDAGDVHGLFCEEEAMRMVGMYPPLHSMEETEERIGRWAMAEGRLAVVLKETGACIGYVAVNPDSEESRENTRELGFALRGDYRGRGYMKEALTAVLEELKEQNVRYVWACCFQENSASEKLIRAMGFEFQQEGTYDAPNDREYKSLEFRITL